MHYKLLLSISLLLAHQSRQGGPDVICWVSVLLPGLLVLWVAALMEWVKLPVLWTRRCSCDVCVEFGVQDEMCTCLKRTKELLCVCPLFYFISLSSYLPTVTHFKFECKKIHGKTRKCTGLNLMKTNASHWLPLKANLYFCVESMLYPMLEPDVHLSRNLTKHCGKSDCNNCDW